MADPAAPSAATPRPLSLWAVASILLALGFLCPPASLIAPLLGFRALVEIKARPERRGRGLAIAGIVIGLVAAAGWTSLGLWWNDAARRPMLEGPRRELAAGFAGDVAGFKEGFTAGGRAASDLEAAAFLRTLRDRYGDFLGSEQAPEAPAGDQVPGGQAPAGGSSGPAPRPPAPAAPADRTQLRIRYVLHFESGPVDAEAAFVLRDGDTGALVLRFAWLAVRDDRAGDAVYPKSAQGIADKTAPAAATP